MRSMKQNTFARALTMAAPVALAFGLAGCFEDGDDDGDVIVITPTPSPTPTPTPTTGTLDVGQCLNQVIPGTGGVTVAEAAIPDVLNINPSAAAGFPNGRKPADPVIDIVLAVLLLDLDAAGQGPTTFADLPLNPDSNDVALPGSFPFLAGPQGSPPRPAGIAGSNFNFRTDRESAYVRVDRMAFPALATALIPSGQPKLTYNDANPRIDASGAFVDDITSELSGLANALQDDLTGLGLNTCAD